MRGRVRLPLKPTTAAAWICGIAAGAWVTCAVAQIPPDARGGTPTGQHATAIETGLDRGTHQAMEFLYSSRLSEAQRVATGLLAVAPEDPRLHILQARILREAFPDQNLNTEHLEALAAPIVAEADRAIAAASRLVDGDAHSVPGYLYRGWAHLFRAQMHTLCGAYWSAGRQAKAGKRDLDRALELDPGNPDAEGVLGTYLYFADVLPGIVKFARTLVRVPGGDRERGLELLRRSANSRAYGRLDSRALIAVIQFAFDGDFAAATRDFEALAAEYPENPRLLEPLAVLDVLRPGMPGAARVETVVALQRNSSESWNRQLAQRLRFYRGVALCTTGFVDAGREILDDVRRNGPRFPDWLVPDAMLCGGEVALLCGEREPAVALHATAAQSPEAGTPDWEVEFHGKVEQRLRFLRDEAAVAPAAEAAVFRRLEAVARDLYAGDVAAAQAALDAMPGDSPPGVAYYRGECARLGGRSEAALSEYARLTRVEIAPRWRLFKNLAFAHTAEIQAARGDARAAARTLEAFLEFDTDRDLLRHALRARRRFFERAADGAVKIPAVIPAPATAR